MIGSTAVELSRLARVAILLTVTLFVSSSSVGGETTKWRWSNVERVVAVADIHGAYEAFVEVLQNAGLIVSEHAWHGGAAHLVIIGDILDRGAGSRAAMELIMELEQQSMGAGGRVHTVLGNHEIMNLVGDLSYVALGEYAAYAKDEDPRQREAVRSRYARVNAEKFPDPEQLLAAFNKQHPPGFFGHRAAFASNGKFGQWLLNKPVLLVVNDSAFAHGGLGEAVVSSDLTSLNERYSASLRGYVRNLEILLDAGVLNVGDDFYAHSRIVADYLAEQAATGRSIPANITAAAEQLESYYRADLFGGKSAIWYRGNVTCNTAISAGRLAKALHTIAAKRLLIGHAPTVSHRVVSRFDGMVIRADTGMLTEHYQGQASAVEIQGDKVAVFYQNEAQPIQPRVLGRRVGSQSGDLGDSELEALLRSAPLSIGALNPDGSQVVTVGGGGKQIKARFIPASGKAKRGVVFTPEVAAYRLDKLLGIDSVPVTVLREVGGKQGALQLTFDSAIDEAQRAEQRKGGDAWCPLREQFNLMYAFDVLIRNEARTPATMLYPGANWQLVTRGYEKAFGTQTKRPAYLKNVPVKLTETLAERLRALDESTAQAALGDVLGAKRIGALLKRRDALLAL